LESCGIAEVKFSRSAIAVPQLFFIPQLRNRFGFPQYCGGADLNCGCPPLHLLRICSERKKGNKFFATRICTLYRNTHYIRVYAHVRCGTHVPGFLFYLSLHTLSQKFRWILQYMYGTVLIPDGDEYTWLGFPEVQKTLYQKY
jgi:hypothetical protein